jgi:probable selenate reductase FAD-binding subunit
MATVTAYWRPSSVAQAFELLERPGAVVLGGGTHLNAGRTDEAIEVVDLQALHLDGIEADSGESVQIGAMVTLQQLVDCDHLPEVVREAARREQPSTLRAQATIGGCVATGHAESELLATLLVFEAVVQVDGRGGAEELPLEAFLASLPVGAARVVLGVTIRTDGRAAVARTARTPADRAIVAAAARQTPGGRRLALCGVAATPILVTSADGLAPAGDFRGSPEYRRALAATLLTRAVEAIA